MVNADGSCVNRDGGLDMALKPPDARQPQMLVTARQSVALLGIPYYTGVHGGIAMASMKQRSAARRNIKKAAAAAKRKQTLKHLPKSTRRALGKEAAKARRKAA